MKKTLIIFTVLMMLCCSACAESGQGYVNESRVQEQFERAQSDAAAEELKLDDKPKVFLQSSCSLSQNSIVVCENDRKKVIDLRTGNISSLCDIPGCAHDINTSEGCLEYRPLNSPLCTEDGMYYTDYNDPGRLHFKSAGEDRVVFENTFYSDLEAELEPEHKTGFGFFIHGDTMFLSGLDYFYTVDMKTMKPTREPVVISDSPIWNMDAYGDDLYITNENLELIRYDMKTETKTKLADKVWRVQPCKSGLYYIKTDGEGLGIFLSEPDGSGEKKLITGVDMGMYVSDSGIFYTSGGEAYMAGLGGETPKKIPLELTYENGEKYRSSEHGSCQFITCPSAKYLWLLDLTRESGEKNCNALFRIDKQTGDCSALSLGIWYQPENGSPELISY